jgi:hypothetical protein
MRRRTRAGARGAAALVWEAPEALRCARRDGGEDIGGQFGRVDRFVCPDAGGLEELADFLLGACAVRRRRCGLVGLADLEQQRVDVDRLAIDRRPDEQRLRARRGAQRREQVVEQHVIGGERGAAASPPSSWRSAFRKSPAASAPSCCETALPRRVVMSG